MLQLRDGCGVADCQWSRRKSSEEGRFALRRNGRLEAMHYAKLCIRLQTGATPLFIAAQKGHTEVARMLVEKGANMNQAAEVRLP